MVIAAGLMGLVTSDSACPPQGGYRSSKLRPRNGGAHGCTMSARTSRPPPRIFTAHHAPVVMASACQVLAANVSQLTKAGAAAYVDWHAGLIGTRSPLTTLPRCRADPCFASTFPSARLGHAHYGDAAACVCWSMLIP